MTMNVFDGEILKRFFKGEYSEKDESYVNEVFREKGKELELSNFLSKQFDELLPEDDINENNLDHILFRIHYDINTRLIAQKTGRLKNILKWTFRIAGIIILTLLIHIEFRNYKESKLKKEAWVEIKAPAWTRAQFSLPDGTTGWLNSNSRIKYNENFYTDRQLNLTGEAFFNVFSDQKRPFIVNTNEINVSVSGTRFNIASYENEKNVEVVLEEGEMIFNNKRMNRSYTMRPNDLVIYDKIQNNYSIELVQPQKYVSWTEGKLVFRNDPLEVIARRLERWYNIDIEIKGKITEDFRLRATFIDDNLEEVLDLLKRSLPINYIIVNRNLKPDDIYAKKKVIINPKTK